MVSKKKLSICWRKENGIPLRIDINQMLFDGLRWLVFSVVGAILVSSITYNHFWPAMAMFLPFAVGFFFFNTKTAIVYISYLNDRRLPANNNQQVAT